VEIPFFGSWEYTLPMSSILRSPSRADTELNWAQYYKLRNRARMGLLAFAIAAYLLPIPVGIVSHTMRPNIQMAVFLVVILTVAAICAIPLFQWAAWRCPRCGKKFAEPQRRFGFGVGSWILPLVLMLWRLVFDSRCGTCKLPCGTTAIRANS
jgi:hypothetical protein